MSRHAPEPWETFALCGQTDPEAYFPHDSTPARHREAAKAVCRMCPVRVECLEDALDKRERFGIRGGLTERERRPLLRARAS